MQPARVLLALLISHPLLLAQPAAGRLTCATCHTGQARSQPATPMGRALLLPPNNDVLKAHPKLEIQRSGYTYAVVTGGDTSVYSVSDGQTSISTPIKWAFGARTQTWVLERNGKMYESLVSFYPQAHGLDTTIGDQSIEPKTLEEAFGRELTESEITSCFGCHSSGSVVQHRMHLDTLREGVTCDHCHTNAGAHLEAISRGKLDSVPARLKTLSAEDMSTFCGQCHRTWGTVVRNRWRGEMNVRFQPYRLANSKCFDGADQRISCVACHDPHQQLVRDDNTYDPKCLACHAPASKAPVCKVAQDKCVSCHMPKTPLPGGHQTFTDHDIRIVRAGDPYPN